MDVKITEPLLMANSKSNGKVTVDKENVKELLGPVEHLPLSVINIAGPPSSGKSILFGYILRYLAAAETDELDWMDYENRDKSLDELQWPKAGTPPDSPGIWGGPQPFILKVGEGSKRKEVAVILLYTQLSNKMQWDPEDGDICALMGLSVSLSSLTIFNVCKQLDEQCLSSVAAYIKYAIQGLGALTSKRQSKSKGKSAAQQLTPLQNASFLIRDWNFSSEYPFGASGGKNFLNEKLKEKTGHSKESRESRLLINHLFENVSGCLLPFPGDGVITPEFQGSVGEMEAKFAKNLEYFISQAVNIDKMVIKRNDRGDVVTGSTFREMIEDYSKAINAVGNEGLNTRTVLKRFRIKAKPSSGEQKEYIKIGMQAYMDAWKRESSKAFLDEKALKDVQKKARNKAIDAFKNEAYPKDDDDDDEEDSDEDDDDRTPDVDERALQLLSDKVLKKFKEIKDENVKKRKQFMEQCKFDFVKQCRNALEAIFPLGGRQPSEREFRRESKEIRENLSTEFLEKLGANRDRDNLDDDQEEELEELKNKMEQEERKYYQLLVGDGGKGDENQTFGDVSR